MPQLFAMAMTREVLLLARCKTSQLKTPYPKPATRDRQVVPLVAGHDRQLYCWISYTSTVSKWHEADLLVQT